MNQAEALQLCRMAKALSPAQAVDEFTPSAWALVLRDWRFEDAETALGQLGGEQEFIHVSHIVARIKRIRRDRIEDYGTLPDPPSSLDPGDTRAYQDWLRRVTRDIADGNPPEMPKLASVPRTVDYDALMPRVPEDNERADVAAAGRPKETA